MRFNFRVLADHLLAFLTAVWVSGFGSRKPQFLEVSVIGGHTCTRRSAWVSQGSRIVFGARILYLSFADFTILFWSGAAYFGKQDNTYSLDFSIP